MVDFDHSPNQSLHSDHRYINLHGLATHRDPIGRLVAALMSRARDSLVLAYIGLVPITAQPIYIYICTKTANLKNSLLLLNCREKPLRPRIHVVISTCMALARIVRTQ